MKFTATIRKSDGFEESRVIEAPSRFALYDQIAREGGRVIMLEEMKGRFRLPAWLQVTIGTGIGRMELVVATKNLSAMLVSGLSLSRALSVIERQSTNKWMKRVIGDVDKAIKRGSSFHEALGTHRDVFSGLFIAMAKAGEESGSLSDSLSVIALQMERSLRLSRKLKGALIYPSIVIVAVITVAVLMLIYVVPTLTRTFAALGADVPLMTQMIVSTSNFMVDHTLFITSLFILLIGGGVLFVRSRIGSTVVLKIALRIPIINDLVRETYCARASRTLASLLASGVPVLDALSITEEVVGAPLFAQVVRDAQARVKSGEPLSAAFLAQSYLYPPLMSEMISVGEETGNLPGMLKQVAQFYEDDLSDKTKDLSAVVEPILMLFVGVVVGLFAVSMIGPIYSLSAAF